jgi:hypothetical protein
LTDAEARRAALALPGAVEQDHHGRPSFRVKGRIFATLWAPGKMNLMLGVSGIMDAVEAHPGVVSEMFWGSRLAAAQVDLGSVQPGVLRELLAAAHARRASPARRAPSA